MVRQYVYFTVILIAAGASALAAGHYSFEPPKEIRSLGQSKFASPRVSVLRPNLPDSCKDAPLAQVWVKFRMDSDGRPHDVQVVWSSIDDTTYEKSAMELVEAKTFTPSSAKGTVPQWWRYHIVLFRSQSEDLCQMDSTLSDSVRFTDVPIIIASGKLEVPRDALEQGDSVSVWVVCRVNSEGNVDSALVRDRSGNDRFDAAAIDAAYRSRFAPALRFGKPVSVWVTYQYKYRRG